MDDSNVEGWLDRPGALKVVSHRPLATVGKYEAGLLPRGSGQLVRLKEGGCFETSNAVLLGRFAGKKARQSLGADRV